jgi:hypothetical protein
VIYIYKSRVKERIVKDRVKERHLNRGLANLLRRSVTNNKRQSKIQTIKERGLANPLF